MAKRQLRISIPALSEKWSEISGKKVNIVMNNRSVIFVKLLKYEGDKLLIENMRLKKQSVDINQISEIIVDTEA